MRPIISTLHTGYTSVGVTVVKTLLGGVNVILPSWCRSVLAVYPTIVADTCVAAFSIQNVAEVESNDLSVMPFQVLPAPVGSVLASGSSFVSKPEKYAFGVRTNGGEQLSVYSTNLFAPTGMTAPNAGCTLVVSNMPAPYGQRHAKIGTLTAAPTATGDAAGTRYNFSGANHIIELMGNMTTMAVVANDGVAGHIKFTSNEFEGVADAKLPLNPISGGLAAAQSMNGDGTSRMPVDIPVASGQVNIQDYINLAIFPAAAGNWVSGVVYE